MGRSAWVQILDAMYDEMMVLEIDSSGESPLNFELPRHSDDDSVTIIADLTDYGEGAVERELRALSAAGLATDLPGENMYGLTETGVRVAHERQQNRQQQYTQKILSYLTGVLAVSASGQFVIGVQQIQPANSITLAVITGYLAVLLGVLLVIRSRFTD